MICGMVLILAFIMLIFNINGVFSLSWNINIIIAVLTILFVVVRFALDKIKRFKTYLTILQNSFFYKTNNELAKIIEEKKLKSTNMLE